ncbi:MAG TPA: hypothetical protein VNL71_08725, partial [Chloroflexota bacterium]|nr:hypothetical protein [Chloroflexota bacterium]
MNTRTQTRPAAIPAAPLFTPARLRTQPLPRQRPDPNRFLQHVPVELHLDLLAVLSAWTRRDGSPAHAVARLTCRLRADLSHPLVDEGRRPHLTMLLTALDAHPRAAVALAAHLHRDET